MSERRFKLADFAVDNRTTIFILTLLLVVFGMMQFEAIPKE